ncbi:MAG: Stk1 family PASTA domain-containing Ser/Thr kinase [Lachnospiraceae bacterium]|nr:Stk1 family PASTA domain-containing Ser/Thr kinase [Lachnospiraceae bacterium]
MIQPGMILGDRYEIIDLIGAGGMADVYKAKDHKLNRFVAIKVLKSEYSSNKNFVSKFRVEAQSAAGLMHPNIVNVYDVGEEDGMYYFVMELVEGITLKNYIEKKICLSVKEAISIAIQVSMGIEAAHNNGIIHRDIKPQNIIISKEGKVKVADFGIARAASSDTITSHAMGSVHYTSPEQARGGYSDAKSDIYSIGITMFEMVTGRVPFDGETTVAIAIKHIQEELPSPRSFVPEIPVSVEQIIYKCTQKNPDRRYANVSELIADLKRSLIHPDENFVVINQAASAEGTKSITDDDRQSIRQQMNVDQMYAGNNYQPQNQPPVYDPYQQPVQHVNNPQPPVYKNPYEEFAKEDELEQVDLFSPRVKKHGAEPEPVQRGKARPERPDPREERQGKGRKQRGRQIEDRREYYDDFDDEDDVDPKMEKIMTILMIVAAVIIAVVAFVVIGNVMGLFGKSSGKEEPGIEAQSGMVAVPDLVGKTFEQASDLLTEAGLTASASRQESTEYEKDYIISQDIEAGTQVATGTQLKLVISSGKVNGGSPVPDLTGKTEAEAKVLLDAEGFVLAVETTTNPNAPKGQIVSQSPLGATTAPRGSTVTVYISEGPPESDTIKVPDLVGKDETTAKSMLTTSGLSWGTITEEHNDAVAAGLVLAQSVAADTEVKAGTTVDFVVSLGSSTYTCHLDVSAPADYFVGTEAVIILTDLTNAEVNRFSTSSFPYTVTQAGISTEMGYVTVNYQGTDGGWHQTSPVAVQFTQE